jgi:hypothetical protein
VTVKEIKVKLFAVATCFLPQAVNLANFLDRNQWFQGCVGLAGMNWSVTSVIGCVDAQHRSLNRPERGRPHRVVFGTVQSLHRLRQLLRVGVHVKTMSPC